MIPRREVMLDPAPPQQAPIGKLLPSGGIKWYIMKKIRPKVESNRSARHGRQGHIVHQNAAEKSVRVRCAGGKAALSFVRSKEFPGF